MTPVAVVCAALFGLGLYGTLTRRDLVAVLACVEVMLGAANVQRSHASSLRHACTRRPVASTRCALGGLGRPPGVHSAGLEGRNCGGVTTKGVWRL